MRGINLNDMPVKHLRKTIAVLNGSNAAWPKQKCIQWLTKKKIDKINVGNFCRTLLRVYMKVNGDGYKVGLTYAEILLIVKNHFPYSAVDKLHLSWYATTMRGKGEMIPVYREKV